MGTRGRETQDMGTQVWHYPPPNRLIPCRTTSNGEGPWVLWTWKGPQGTWRQDRWPPGRCPFRDQRRSREFGRPWCIQGLGRPWRIRGLRRPWRIRGLGWPWRIRGLRRPWRIRGLGWPWRIRGLRRPWRIRGLGWPWQIQGLRWQWRIRGLRGPWRVAPSNKLLGKSTTSGGCSGVVGSGGCFGVDSVSFWTGAGPGVDSVSSWTGAGPGVDSVSSWTGAGPGVDSVSSWTGAGSGVDSVSSWTGLCAWGRGNRQAWVSSGGWRACPRNGLRACVCREQRRAWVTSGRWTWRMNGRGPLLFSFFFGSVLILPTSVLQRKIILFKLVL